MPGACLQVCALQWNPHEREILSSHGFSQNQLCLWKYPSMAKVGEFTGHSARVLHMARVRNCRSLSLTEYVLCTLAEWHTVHCPADGRVVWSSPDSSKVCRVQMEPLSARQLLTKPCASGGALVSLHLLARARQQRQHTVLCPPLPLGKVASRNARSMACQS